MENSQDFRQELCFSVTEKSSYFYVHQCTFINGVKNVAFRYIVFEFSRKPQNQRMGATSKQELNHMLHAIFADNFPKTASMSNLLNTSLIELLVSCQTSIHGLSKSHEVQPKSYKNREKPERAVGTSSPRPDIVFERKWISATGHIFDICRRTLSQIEDFLQSF